jgi:acyl-CoA thioesterase-1
MGLNNSFAMCCNLYMDPHHGETWKLRRPTGVVDLARIRGTSARRSRGVLAAVSLVSTWLAITPAEAQEFRIVALGASNTAGRGVGALNAWPARLEVLLRSRGHNVRVVNAGINGDDTNGMRTRLRETVSTGTRLVILDTTDTNDRRRRVNTKANATAIVDELSRRGIRTIVVPSLHALSEHRLQGDGIHITADGHAAVADKLASKISSIVGTPRGRSAQLQ